MFAGTVVAGRYRLGERVGLGALCDVWRAVDDHTGRAVVVKTVREEVLDVERARAALQAEGRMLQDRRFRGVPVVWDVLPEALVLEACGSDLQRALALGGRWTEQEAVRVGLALVDVLSEVHRAGVVHRDVKLENILVAEDGTIRLSDFGIALVDGEPVGSGQGSRSTMAPEQVAADDGQDVGPAVDRYAVGAVVFALATGGDPIDLHACGERSPRFADLSPSLASWIRGMTRPDPAERPDWPEARRRLLEVLEACELAPPATPSTPIPVGRVPTADGPPARTREPDLQALEDRAARQWLEAEVAHRRSRARVVSQGLLAVLLVVVVLFAGLGARWFVDLAEQRRPHAVDRSAATGDVVQLWEGREGVRLRWQRGGRSRELRGAFVGSRLVVAGEDLVFDGRRVSGSLVGRLDGGEGAREVVLEVASDRGR